MSMNQSESNSNDASTSAMIQHKQNCLQIDPKMNQTIHSIPKLSWASDHERIFNFGRTSKSQQAW